MTNTQTVDAYFDAMRNRNAEAVRALFTEDAELINWLDTITGVDAIVAFYRDRAFSVDDFRPEPGPLLTHGDLVAVELRVRVGDAWTHVADFFTVEGGKIARLVMYQR
jgi:ketosteroid isomerase-like protein